MLSPQPRGPRRVRTLLAAVATAAVAVAAPLTAAAPALADTPDLPQVVPSLDDWEGADGTFTATGETSVVVDTSDERLNSSAEIFTEELATALPGVTVSGGQAGAGDIELLVDPDRAEDLGDEGYELDVDSAITVTAATDTGAFWGTRTLLQMLTQQSELPFGSAIDVPAYTERGVTLCACVINISPDFIDRLLEDMSYLKLNTLLIEMKLKVDEYPETNTWSYYTKDDVRELVAKADQYGIDVIPEINSPGHMEIWLENLPDLQLTNENTGETDEVRMDITKDASFDFYTDLIDEYAGVFTSDYWHMGVDEYMLGSGYANFPQIKQFAEAQWGPTATEDDVVAWYVNKVNDYVQGMGKTLRIWNDGVITDNEFVDFDTDIVIEHWNNAASQVNPQQFIDWGHEIVNVSNALYMVRDSYAPDVQQLYSQDWTPRNFFNGRLTGGFDQIRGARLSAWPDAGTPGEAENTTEERLFEPMRFVAQTTWSDSKPWSDYSAFKAAMDEIGRSPLWNNVERRPVPDGAFTVSAADGSGALAAGEGGSVVLNEDGDGLDLTFTHNDAGYYTITTNDGRCLDLSREGTMRLSVPVEIGADVVLATCSDTTLQQWQVKRAGDGFHIINAASQQHLSISDGLTDVPVAHEDFKNVPDGLVVQTPADWGTTEWTFDGSLSMQVALDAAQAVPGGSIDATVTIGNFSGGDLSEATVRVASTPAGWTALPGNAPVDELAQGGTTSLDFTLYNVAGDSDSGPFSFELVDSGGQVIATATAQVASTCSTERMSPEAIASVSSEQTSGEAAGSGPATAAIDGDPATFWHSQYAPTEADYPHAIVVDLGEENEVCGLWYTGRSGGGSGGANGRIADYEVFTSTTTGDYESADWGEPVATGSFMNTAEPQLASFDATEVRYVMLVALSEVNNNMWATIGELELAGPAGEAPQYSPELTLGADEVTAGEDVAAVATGFAPGELVEFAVGDGEAVTGQADADGRLEATIPTSADLAEDTYVVTASGTATGATATADLAVLAADDGDSDGSDGSDDTGGAGDDGSADTGGADDDGSAAAGGADDDGSATAGADTGDDDSATAGAGDDGSDDGSETPGPLPDTGASVGGYLAIAAVLLIGGVVAVVLRRRSSGTA